MGQHLAHRIRNRARATTIGYADFRGLAEDITIALGWVPETGLRTTIAEMALRWSTTPFEVRGALRLVGLTRELTTDWSDGDEESDDAPVHVMFLRD